MSAFFDARTASNTSYIFAADANGDTATNDLIYIPRDASEMNFVQFTSSGRTFTAADQVAAFDAYIAQDDYLSKHRGQYAERGAVFYPFIKRLDLSVTQDLFTNIGGMKHSGQIRLDITNFGNMLNHNWGVGYSIIQNRMLIDPARRCKRGAVLPAGDGAAPSTGPDSSARRSSGRPAHPTST